MPRSCVTFQRGTYITNCALNSPPDVECVQDAFPILQLDFWVTFKTTQNFRSILVECSFSTCAVGYLGVFYSRETFSNSVPLQRQCEQHVVRRSVLVFSPCVRNIFCMYRWRQNLMIKALPHHRDYTIGVASEAFVCFRVTWYAQQIDMGRRPQARSQLLWPSIL